MDCHVTRARAGSEPGFRRPVVVVQGNALNRGRVATVVCVPLTSNLMWAEAPGNTRLSAKVTGLPKDSVANALQITMLDRTALVKRVRSLASRHVNQILDGISIVLGDQAS
ncbi:MAG: type II toxin-antitoxin system PemK/MazF family toxin [Gemmatimonadales bacterium]